MSTHSNDDRFPYPCLMGILYPIARRRRRRLPSPTRSSMVLSMKSYTPSTSLTRSPSTLPSSSLPTKVSPTLPPTPKLRRISLKKILSDPFVLTMADSDHSNVPNETKPDVIFKVLLEFAKIRKYNVIFKRNDAPKIVFSIILPPLSTDASQTAYLEQHLMHTKFAFDVRFQGTATPWRNFKGELMSCSECHSVAHYRNDCLIINSDSYKIHYGQNSESDEACYVIRCLSRRFNDTGLFLDTP
ncbi:hypothetical protein B0H13DRAFT_1178714 [Mycena leptocephala]|nr:hypothetical protein B0H13DRAFT_1178714 [Mycena leptocephala]